MAFEPAAQPSSERFSFARAALLAISVAGFLPLDALAAEREADAGGVGCTGGREPPRPWPLPLPVPDGVPVPRPRPRPLPLPLAAPTPGGSCAEHVPKHSSTKIIGYQICLHRRCMKKGVRVERARGAEGCGKEMRAGHADAAAAAHATRSGRRERRGARQRRRPRRRRRAAVQAIQAWRATVASRSSRVRWPSRRQSAVRVGVCGQTRRWPGSERRASVHRLCVSVTELRSGCTRRVAKSGPS